MAITTQWWSRFATSLTGVSTPTFLSPYGGFFGSASTEATHQPIISAGGKLKSFYVVLLTAPGASPRSRDFTVKLNGSNTALTVNITGTTTVASVTTDVTVAAGDRVYIASVGSATAAATTNAWFFIEFEPSTQDNFTYPSSYGAPTNLNTDSGSVPVWQPLFGGSSTRPITTSAVGTTQNVAPFAGTITAFYVQLQSAPGTGRSWTFIVELNGSEVAATSITISGNTATTGNVTGLSVAVAAGDLLAFKVKAVSGASPAAGGCGWAVTFVPTPANLFAFAATNSGNPSTSATTYLGVVGATSNTNATESNVRCPLPAAVGVYASYAAMVTTPGGAASWTYTLRKNGADQALSFAVSNPNTSGSATSPTVNIAANDFLNLALVPASSPANQGGQSWSLALGPAPSATTQNHQLVNAGLVNRGLVNAGLAGE